MLAGTRISVSVASPDLRFSVGWPLHKRKNPMKRSKLALVVVGIVLASLASAQAAVEAYDIDPVHTWVGFSIAHFFTKVPGFFSKVKGSVVVDRSNLAHSTVEAVIEAASITTNTPMRDDDLRSANFFAVARFPAMTFKSKAWKSTGGDTYAVTGDLTIKSVTKEVALKVTSLGFGPGMKGAAISGWEVSTTLDRRDFDVAADQGMIGNSVDVVIHVEADLRKPTAATP
jgi:polyisoprenoid-binding protein YceI